MQGMGVTTALPAAELGLYSLVLSGALAYAGRGLLEASQGNTGLLGRGVGPFFSWGPQSSNQQSQKLRGSRPRVVSGPGDGAEPGTGTGDTEAGTLTETWTQPQRERHSDT